MGTLAAATPIIGLLAGKILAHLTPTEQLQGKKYFLITQHILLSVILAVILWQNKTIAITSAITLCLILWKTNYTHPIWLNTILAVPATLIQNTQIPIFLYLIPTGTLNYKENKKLMLTTIFYILITFTI